MDLLAAHSQASAGRKVPGKQRPRSWALASPGMRPRRIPQAICPAEGEQGALRRLCERGERRHDQRKAAGTATENTQQEAGDQPMHTPRLLLDIDRRRHRRLSTHAVEVLRVVADCLLVAHGPRIGQADDRAASARFRPMSSPMVGEEPGGLTSAILGG